MPTSILDLTGAGECRACLSAHSHSGYILSILAGANNTLVPLIFRGQSTIYLISCQYEARDYGVTISVRNWIDEEGMGCYD